MGTLVVPEDDDPGYASSGDEGSPAYGQGCTNYGEPECDCIEVFGSGLHVSKIHVYGKTLGQYQGRWEVFRNGHLFVRSTVVTFNSNGWTWAKGWTFADGDQLCGGFWTTTGHWLDQQNGPACVGIHS
jgi:hypothetical protein